MRERLKHEQKRASDHSEAETQRARKSVCGAQDIETSKRMDQQPGIERLPYGEAPALRCFLARQVGTRGAECTPIDVWERLCSAASKEERAL